MIVARQRGNRPMYPTGKDHNNVQRLFYGGAPEDTIVELQKSTVWETRIPVNVDFADEKSLPPMTNITAMDVRKWIGEVVYFAKPKQKATKRKSRNTKQKENENKQRCGNAHMQTATIFSINEEATTKTKTKTKAKTKTKTKTKTPNGSTWVTCLFPNDEDGDTCQKFTIDEILEFSFIVRICFPCALVCY